MQVQKHSFVQKTPKTIKTDLSLQGKRCCITSHCSVKQNSAEHISSNVLINDFCLVNGDLLQKTFTITSKDFVIVVSDTINFNFQQEEEQVPKFNQQSKLDASLVSNSLSEESKKKKIILFKNLSLNSDQSKGKSNKKNIVKNIVNAFLKYLKDKKGQNIEIDHQIEATQQLVLPKKFNNQLITIIIGDLSLRHYFEYFLLNIAPQWIQNSKIKFKDVYKDALKIYQKLCNQKQKQQERVHLKNNNFNNNSNHSFSSDQKNSNNSICFMELQNYDLEDQIKGFK